MKKLVCLLVALILCVSCVALAAAAPSKNTSNMTQTTGQSTSGMTNVNTAEAFAIYLVTDDMVEHQDLIDIAKKEIEKIAASESVEAYFGALGADLKAKVEAETLNVNELYPVVATGYTEELGNVTVQFQFATPYAAGDKVVVTVGNVTVAADGTQTVAWTAFNAAVVAESVVEITLDPASVLAIQNGTALLAVVSK